MGRPRYLLITLSSGTVPSDTSYIIVMEWPTWRYVDVLKCRHKVYEYSFKGFAGAAVDENKLLVTREAEILVINLCPLFIEDVITKKYFNDLHHITCSEDSIIVTNSGLDCIEIFDKKLDHRKSIFLSPFFRSDVKYLWWFFRHAIRKSWRKRKDNSLYQHLNRRVPFPNVMKYLSPPGLHRSDYDLRYFDLRPHFVHPNHVTVIGEALWVTLWGPGVILRIPDGRTLASGLGHPHDGIVRDSEYFVTDCKDSKLMVFDMNGHLPTKMKLSKRLMPANGPGFVRGIEVWKNKIFVGLSTLRGHGKFPFARILEIDRRSGEIEKEHIIPKEYGTSIYSIIDVTKYYI